MPDPDVPWDSDDPTIRALAMLPAPKGPADMSGVSNALGIPQMVGALGGALSNIAQLPKKAFESSEGLRTGGDYDPAPVTQASMLLMGGGVPAAEEGAAGVFGGKLARTADLSKLAEAKWRSSSMGNSPEEIFNNTGWYQGKDKQWRFEIPDTDAKFSGGLPGTLGEALQHPALYDAYPDLKHIPLEWGSQPGNAFHTAALPVGKMGFSPQDNPEDLTATALHEIQHGIQWREGFAPGSSPVDHEAKVADALEKMGVLKRSSPTTYEPIVPDAEKQLKSVAYELYKRHAGEVEARNASERYSNPLTSLLSGKFPLATEDVPQAQQIVRKPLGNSPYQDILAALRK